MKRTYQPNTRRRAQEARLPPPHEHPRRPCRAEGPPCQGAARCRLDLAHPGARAAFAALATRGNVGTEPQARGAHAFPIRPARRRRVGRVRSRCRDGRGAQPLSRRQRARADPAGAVDARSCPPGWYLESARHRRHWSFAELRRRRAACAVARAAAQAGLIGESRHLASSMYQRAVDGRPSPLPLHPVAARPTPSVEAPGRLDGCAALVTALLPRALPPVRSVRLVDPVARAAPARNLTPPVKKRRRPHDRRRCSRSPPPAAQLVLRPHGQLHPGHLD